MEYQGTFKVDCSAMGDWQAEVAEFSTIPDSIKHAIHDTLLGQDVKQTTKQATEPDSHPEYEGIGNASDVPADVLAAVFAHFTAADQSILGINTYPVVSPALAEAIASGTTADEVQKEDIPDVLTSETSHENAPSSPVSSTEDSPSQPVTEDSVPTPRAEAEESYPEPAFINTAEQICEFKLALACFLDELSSHLDPESADFRHCRDNLTLVLNLHKAFGEPPLDNTSQELHSEEFPSPPSPEDLPRQPASEESPAASPATELSTEASTESLSTPPSELRSKQQTGELRRANKGLDNKPDMTKLQRIARRMKALQQYDSSYDPFATAEPLPAAKTHSPPNQSPRQPDPEGQAHGDKTGGGKGDTDLEATDYMSLLSPQEFVAHLNETLSKALKEPGITLPSQTPKCLCTSHAANQSQKTTRQPAACSKPMTPNKIFGPNVMDIIDRMPCLSSQTQRRHLEICDKLVAMEPVHRPGVDNVIRTQIIRVQLDQVLDDYEIQIDPKVHGPCTGLEVYMFTNGMDAISGREVMFWSSKDSEDGPPRGLQVPPAPSTHDAMSRIQSVCAKEKRKRVREDREACMLNGAIGIDDIVQEVRVEGSWASQEQVMASLSNLTRESFKDLLLDEYERDIQEQERKDASMPYAAALSYITGEDTARQGSLQNLVTHDRYAQQRPLEEQVRRRILGCDLTMETCQGVPTRLRTNGFADLDTDRNLDREELQTLAYAHLRVITSLRRDHWQPMNYDLLTDIFERQSRDANDSLITMMSQPLDFFLHYMVECTHHWAAIRESVPEGPLPHEMRTTASTAEAMWRWDAHYDLVGCAFRRVLSDSIISYELLRLVNVGTMMNEFWGARGRPGELSCFQRETATCISTIAKGYMMHMIRDMVKRRTFISGLLVRQHFVRRTSNADVVDEDGALFKSVQGLPEINITRITESDAQQKQELMQEWNERADPGELFHMWEMLENTAASDDIEDPRALVERLTYAAKTEPTRHLLSPIIRRFLDRLRQAAALIDPRAVDPASRLEHSMVRLRTITSQVTGLYVLRQMDNFEFHSWKTVPTFRCHRLYASLDQQLWEGVDKSLGTRDPEGLANELHAVGMGILQHFRDQALSLSAVGHKRLAAKLTRDGRASKLAAVPELIDCLIDMLATYKRPSNREYMRPFVTPDTPKEHREKLREAEKRRAKQLKKKEARRRAAEEKARRQEEEQAEQSSDASDAAEKEEEEEETQEIEDSLPDGSFYRKSRVDLALYDAGATWLLGHASAQPNQIDGPSDAIQKHGESLSNTESDEDDDRESIASHESEARVPSPPPAGTRGRIAGRHWEKIVRLLAGGKRGLSWPEIETVFRQLGYARLADGGGSLVKFRWTPACLWPMDEVKRQDGLGCLGFHRVHHNKSIFPQMVNSFGERLRKSGLTMEFVQEYYEVR